MCLKFLKFLGTPCHLAHQSKELEDQDNIAFVEGKKTEKVLPMALIKKRIIVLKSLIFLFIIFNAYKMLGRI